MRHIRLAPNSLLDKTRSRWYDTDIGRMICGKGRGVVGAIGRSIVNILTCSGFA